MSYKNILRIIWIGIVLILLIPNKLALAKELGKITITGPGISGTLIVDEPAELQRLWEGEIMDFTTPASTPESPGEGYIMTMYLKIESGVQPMLQLTYYPGQVDGQGLFNAVVLMPENGEVDRVGKWYQVPKRTEGTIKKMLASHGINVSGEPMRQPITANTTVVWSAGILALLLGVALFVRRLFPTRHARVTGVEE